MSDDPTQPFAERGSKHQVEEGLLFAPTFGADGLIPCIATDADSGEVVMFAHMNARALAETIATGIAHYWSRSRNALWRKGEASGNIQSVVEMRTDCDQDVVWIKVRTAGHGANCHTGRRSCFYREVMFGPEAGRPPRLRLRPDDEPAFDPGEVYGKS